MSLKTYQRAFNGGVVSPAMFARIDDGKYQTGLAVCKNFLIEPQGPLASRPGFSFVNHTKSGSARLIPFTFSATQTMVLELGPKYIRFHTQGKTLLGSDGKPYEVQTPYEADDIMDIHYVQSADIVTLVHPRYAPRELRRYGATDWRLQKISFTSTLSAPSLRSVTQTIDEKVTNPTAYTREYCVTALLSDGSQESSRSNSIKISCNPYGDGAYNTITWSSVSGAGLYRVYRDQGGVWAYIGQTDKTNIVDENISPDASITPPVYDDPFGQDRGISSVRVTNGGSGYQAITDADKIYEEFVNSSGSFTDKIHDSFYEDMYQIDEKKAGADYFTTTVVFKINRNNVQNLRTGIRLGKWTVENYYQITDVDGTGARALLFFEKSFHMGTNADGNDYATIVVRLDKVMLTEAGSGYVDPHFEIGNTSFGYRLDWKWAGRDDWHNGSIQVKRWFPKTVKLPVSYPPSAYIIDPSGHGTGAELGCSVRYGKVTDLVVKSPGSNYENPQVVILGGGGKGATASATVGQTGDYPSAVSYFEQRRWFGGTPVRPNHLWATRSGTESDMSYSLPTKDDDRIAVRVAARESNRIEHIVPLSQLILLTGASEWRVSPLNSDAITPASMSVRPQSYVGASNVQPLVIGSSMIYGACRGGHLRELGYSYEAGGYTTGDLCLRAPHLFDNLEIVDLAYSKAPYPVVWAVSSAGTLIAMTYVPEQQVGAFSTIETQGKFMSVCAVAEGEEDVIYAVVSRVIGGKEVYSVERMHERKFTTLADCVHLDCCGTYRGAANDVISGLTWLEGMTVSILADGAVEPDQVVTDGKIKLTQAAEVVHVGLPYTSDLKTLPVAAQLNDGSFGTAHRKNVRGVSLRVIESSGISAGPSFDSLAEFPSRCVELPGSVPELLSEEVTMEVSPAWSEGGQVCVRQRYPLPLRITSMTVDVELV